MEGWGWDDIKKRRERFTERFRNFFIFDIETVKDSDMFSEIADEKEIEREENGEFLSLPFNRVVSVSYMSVKDGNVERFEAISSEDESELLNHFWTAFRDSHSKNENNKIEVFPVLITINGKDFDVPVIKLRSLKHIPSIKFSTYISIFMDRFDRWEDGYPRYSDRFSKYHIDIPVDLFGKKVSLKNLCYLCGIPVKQEGSGEKVQEFFQNGELEKIARYCAEDVKATALLFSYINENFLFKQYIFPSITQIEVLEPTISVV